MPETIYTTSQRYDLAISAGLVVITRGISRAKDHWGEAVVTLTQYPAPPDTRAIRPPARQYRCRGGNYDMRGKVVGYWIGDQFPDGIKKLDCRRVSGLVFLPPCGVPERHVLYHDGDQVLLDGGCGYSCMQGILWELGFDLVCIHASHNREDYELRAL